MAKRSKARKRGGGRRKSKGADRGAAGPPQQVPAGPAESVSEENGGRRDDGETVVQPPAQAAQLPAQPDERKGVETTGSGPKDGAEVESGAPAVGSVPTAERPVESSSESAGPSLPTAEPGRAAPEDPLWVRLFDHPWRGPLLVFTAALVVFCAFASERLARQSKNPHYVLLANALLNGRWHLQGAPHHPVTGDQMSNDWAFYEVLRLKNGKLLKGRTRGWSRGKRRFVDLRGRTSYVGRSDLKPGTIPEKRYFVSFPPMPAFLMMPAVWAFGDLGVRYKDTLFTFFFAAIAVMLMFLMLQRMSALGISLRTRRENLYLTLLFGLGTVFFFVAVQGTVWFTALVLGACFTIGFMMASWKARHPLIAGVMLGSAFLCRPLLLLTGLFFLGQLFTRDDKWDLRLNGERLLKLVLIALPVAVAVGGMMYVNYIRFDSPFTFGHEFLPAVYRKAIQYGLFHPHWVPRNVFASLLLLPSLSGQFPYFKISAHGLSLLITTPALIYLFMARKKGPVYWTLAAAALVVYVPTLFYQNTGWEQFGYRFSVDFTPYLVAMLAVGRVTISPWFTRLVWVGVGVNAFGAAIFDRARILFHSSIRSLDWVYRLF